MDEFPSFFGRPDIPQLGLDLRWFHGGIGYPSESRGQTTDGRLVHVRYRYGLLTVRCDPPGHASDPAKETGDRLPVVLEARIGPYWGGCLLPEQMCDILGLMVGGRPPELDDGARESIESGESQDVSGARTYWTADIWLLPEERDRFVAAIRDAGGPCRVLDRLPGPPPYYRSAYVEGQDVLRLRHPVFGFGEGPRRLPLTLPLPTSGGASAHLERAFDLALHLPGGWWAEPPSDEAPGAARDWRATERQHWERLAAVAGHPLQRAPGHARGFALAHFATEDAQAWSIARRVDALLRCSCSTVMDTYDLATGEVITREATGTWLGPALTAWCREAPGRVLNARFEDPTDGGGGRALAQRPSGQC